MLRSRRLAAFGFCLTVSVSLLWGANHTFDGIYTGKRSLTKGTAGPNCAAEEGVSITVHGKTLSFTNSALQNFGIGFYPHPDGSFHQTYTDEGGDAVNISGRVFGEVIEADVTNPPCECHWYLKKQ